MADSGIVRGQYLLMHSNVSRPATGSVTFIPVEPDEVVVGETLITRAPVEATFNGEGWVHTKSTLVDYVRLPAGRWTVKFAAPGLTLKQFQFDVAPDATVNLPAVAPLVPSPAVKFVVNELVYTETLDARDETFEARDVAVQAAADAVTPTNTVVDARIDAKRGAANGVAGLGSDSKLPETQVPDRLSAAQLSSTIGAAVSDGVAGKANTADVYSKSAADAAITAALAAPLARIQDLEVKVQFGEFRIKVAGRIALIQSQPMDHMAFGDSITVGQGASAPNKRWVDLVRDGVRSRRNPAGVVGGFGYIPIRNVYASVLPNIWELGGGAVEKTGNQGQPNGSYTQLAAAGESATLTFTGTGVRVHFTNYNTSNPIGLDITIDGSAVARPTFGANPANDAAYIDYTGLAAGTHTIVIAHNSTNAVPYFIHGAMIFNGDATTGWRTMAHARSGSTVNGAPNLSQWVAAYAPDVVTIYYGTNEYRNNNTPASFKTNLEGLLTKVQANSPSAAILLIKGYQPAHPGTPANPWSAFRTAVDQVGAAASLPVLDLAQQFGSGIPTTAMAADGVHPTDLGHQTIANMVMTAMGI